MRGQLALIGDTSGLQAFLENNVLGLVLVGVAIWIIVRMNKGDFSKGITIFIGVLLGLTVLGLSVAGNALNVGVWLSHLAFGA